VSRGIIKAPGVNLLATGDPSQRIRTLGPGDSVEVLEGTGWLRVTVDGVAGLVPAAAVDLDERSPLRLVDADEGLHGIQCFEGGRSFVGEPILAHVDFHAALRRLDEYALRVGVRIHVERSFRRLEEDDAEASGRRPRRSNHSVGHAIDVSLIVAGEHLEGARLGRDRLRELPAAVRYLVQQIRQDVDLRWGGDFVRPEPSHIDDDLYRRAPEQWWRTLKSL